MKFIKVRAPIPKEQLLSVLSNSEFVNSGVRFDKYIPEMRLKHSKRDPDKIRITAQMKNTPTKDNGFLVGTYFSGRVTEKDGVSTVRGYIATAPIYHFILLLFVAFFVYQCFAIGGFNPTPVILVLFDLVLFWREFKKQGMLERYILRAARKSVEQQGKTR